VNAYLVHTGDALILVDTGTAKAFGPDLGFVVDNLKAAGYQPEQVSHVLLTHLHPDHVNGLVSADGRALFSNAQIHVAKAEADFWLDAAIAAKAPKDAQPFFAMAKKAMSPYQAKGSLKLFAGVSPLLAGVTPVPLPGHTPGHTGFLLESKGMKLLIWGDILHNYASQLADPGIAIEFDTDTKAAVATRRAILKRVAKEKLMIAGMHLPFPGVGHIRADGKSYTYVPIEFGPLR
jgi:glyoxylase-like metal-dependent hydrolase (beta-lactamase superfamily II)